MSPPIKLLSRWFIGLAGAWMMIGYAQAGMLAGSAVGAFHVVVATVLMAEKEP